MPKGLDQKAFHTAHAEAEQAEWKVEAEEVKKMRNYAVSDPGAKEDVKVPPITMSWGSGSICFKVKILAKQASSKGGSLSIKLKGGAGLRQHES